jgi:hypothetical protein
MQDAAKTRPVIKSGQAIGRRRPQQQGERGADGGYNQGVHEIPPGIMGQIANHNVIPGMERWLEINKGNVKRTHIHIDGQFERGDHKPV